MARSDGEKAPNAAASTDIRDSLISLRVYGSAGHFICEDTRAKSKLCSDKLFILDDN